MCTTFGLRSCAAIFASRWKRSRASRAEARSGCMNLTAQGTSSFTCCDSQTQPCPPSPSSRTKRNRSATTSPALRGTRTSLGRALRLHDAGVVRLLTTLFGLVHAVGPSLLLGEGERREIDTALVELKGILVADFLELSAAVERG